MRRTTLVLALTCLYLSAVIAEIDHEGDEGSLDKRAPNMMYYNYPFYRNYHGVGPGTPTSGSGPRSLGVRLKKRTPFYLPGSSKNWFHGNWFKRNTEAPEEAEESGLERERRAVYFMPPSLMNKMWKRGVHYYPVFPYNYRKRFRKRSDGAASSEESGELKRGLLMEDLENEDPTSFGYDRKRRSEPNGSWSSDPSEEI